MRHDAGFLRLFSRGPSDCAPKSRSRKLLTAESHPCQCLKRQRHPALDTTTQGNMNMNTFANIDVNKLASSKQFNGVCAHYTNIIAKAQGLTQAESYILYKRMRGAIGHYFGTVLDSRMTHGDVQTAFAATTVPSEIMTLIKIKDQKPAAQKPTAQKPTAQEAPKKVGRPKGSKNKAQPEAKPLAAVKNNDLDARVAQLETKVTTLDSKLDAILNILQAK